MNQIEAAVAEYSKTILDLQTRLANAAAQICGLMEQVEAKSKECEELKAKGPPADRAAHPDTWSRCSDIMPPALKAVKDSA